jgi:hypothetical protein
LKTSRQNNPYQATSFLIKSPASAVAQMKNSTNSIMSKKIELVTRKSQADCLKQPLTKLAEDNSVQLLVSSHRVHIVGIISEQGIKQLHLAGYAVCRFAGEYGIYSKSLSVPLGNGLPWQGVKTILENCGQRVIVKA